MMVQTVTGSRLFAVDLFSGCGGLSLGLHEAGFEVVAAIDNDRDSVATYRMNHPRTTVIEGDIRCIGADEITEHVPRHGRLHLVAGCPPCQGFSSIRRLNRKHSVRDSRNRLILDYLRVVTELKPLTVMLENVPGVAKYTLFHHVVKSLRVLGYRPSIEEVNIERYGVPQRRKRLVLVGSLLGPLTIAEPTNERVTVEEAIGHMESVADTDDPIHRIVAKHSPSVMQRIRATPKNGGSRKQLPSSFQLRCHTSPTAGFNDIYGRLRWDDVAPTITGGCLNPSKGRFLHPREDRAITAREAALLQTFPQSYSFPSNITKTSIAALIGNALPPKFSEIQASHIRKHLHAAGF